MVSHSDLCTLFDRMLHNVALNGTLGAISGLGNIAPASLVKVFNLYKQGKFDEAKKAQEAVSIAGELEIKGGVPGMRVSGCASVTMNACCKFLITSYVLSPWQYGVVKYYGYGGISRK
jgi:dihydrodipicolinate synthase/N-acetylneuraminate lyase